MEKVDFLAYKCLPDHFVCTEKVYHIIKPTQEKLLDTYNMHFGQIFVKRDHLLTVPNLSFLKVKSA